jgi:hypothetical protein
VSTSWEQINRQALVEHTVPLWNPYQFGGRPHLANPEMLALYPPHVLLRFLPLPLFIALSLSLHGWLAGIGTYLAARHLHRSRPIAAAAGGAVLCGWLVMSFEDIASAPDVYRMAWIPLIAVCALRSAERPSWLPRPGLVVAATLGLIASALNPAYVLAPVVICYLFEAMRLLSSERRYRPLVAQLLILACLVTGLSAVQAVPSVRFWSTMRRDRSLLVDVPPLTLADGGSTQQNPEIMEALRSLGARGRVLSTCDRAIDGSDFVALRVAGIGGYGGVFLADYARFANLVRGSVEMAAVFEGIPEATRGEVRVDLLRFFGIEYLVSCISPDPSRWAVVKHGRDVGIYRSLVPAPRAFWTCVPVPVGRRELEYRLRHESYDPRLVLQPHAMIHVRWSARISDDDRSRAEVQLHLEPHRDIGDRTWEYNLLERSRESIAAIAQHPLVEDTQGIDRGALALTAPEAAIPEFDEPKSEWLLGVAPCDVPAPATVVSQDRVDGRMVVEVDAPHDGIVFFSEPYYLDRVAWVDGRRTPRMKTNLAFTAVRVSAGTHRVELKYDTRALRAGAGVSVVTLLVWLVAERRVRRRSPRP